ncbi:MAG: ATP-dependent protease, Lon family, partial [Firmicutes bacterium]|nr:ATP-dependent protease, Lon family [Bacillota bacterium]
QTAVRIGKEHLLEVIRTSRLIPFTKTKSKAQGEIGKIYGLGVHGFVGSIIEIEAVSFPAEKGKGKIRFNETAGSMAKDSVFNAVSVVRLLTGLDVNDYDLHVNIIGGGRIDGPSAGVAITLAIISCLQQRPIRQDIAVTGEVSIQGKVKEVGGIFEKIYGAKQAGVKEVFIPVENKEEIPSLLDGIRVRTVATVKELIDYVFVTH